MTAAESFLHAWLTSPEGREELAAIAQALTTPAIVERLRRSLPVDRVAALLEMAELRRRAARKFCRADRMFFTRRGLEQSTDEAIARYKAARFLGHERVLDLCCGVGGDLSGMASVGLGAIGMERDPGLVCYAKENAEAYGESVSVRCAEVAAPMLAEGDAWHADPDRRAGGRRSTQPDAHEPSLAQLEAWRGVVPAAAIKLAPAARLPESWQQECELEWISREGECKQLVAWCGALATEPGKRKATRLPTSLENRTEPAASWVGQPDLPIATTEGSFDFLLEPDPAVLAAGLTGALASKWGLGAMVTGIPYLTASTEILDPLLATFRVEERLPFDRKRLSRWLSERRVGRLEIKCRGVAIEPAELRRSIRLKGDAERVLLIAPTEGNRRRPQVVVCCRC